MNVNCGDWALPTPWGHLVRRAGVYVRILIIMVVLVIGTKLGLDPITMIGWGALAWLFLGQTGGAAGGRVHTSRRVR